MLTPSLVVEKLQVRGSVLLITGRAERGAIVTINGEGVDVRADGSRNTWS